MADTASRCETIFASLDYSGVLQSAQFHLFMWLFWRTPSTLKIAKSSPPPKTVKTGEETHKLRNATNPNVMAATNVINPIFEQQCDILTSVHSDQHVQPLFML